MSADFITIVHTISFTLLVHFLLIRGNAWNITLIQILMLKENLICQIYNLYLPGKFSMKNFDMSLGKPDDLENT